MAELAEQSPGLIRNDGINNRQLRSEVTALAPHGVRKAWQTYISGPRLPRRTAWAIIQVVALLFWLALIAAIYFAVHR